MKEQEIYPMQRYSRLCNFLLTGKYKSLTRYKSSPLLVDVHNFIIIFLCNYQVEIGIKVA